MPKEDAKEPPLCTETPSSIWLVGGAPNRIFCCWFFPGLFLEFRSVILSFRHFRRPLSGKVLLISLSGNSGAPQLFIWLWLAGSISAVLTVCGGGHCACKSGSGIRSPSRSKPAPVSATAKAPPHQTASGDVASSAPPTAGPRATPAVKERP